MSARRACIHCPECGCNDVAATGTVRQSWRQAAPTGDGKHRVESVELRGWRCNYCAEEFDAALPTEAKTATDAETATLAYPIRACPECGAKRPRVTSSPTSARGAARVRYHKCESCGVQLKSVEKPK